VFAGERTITLIGPDLGLLRRARVRFGGSTNPSRPRRTW
jgi:hypothetical protein